MIEASATMIVPVGEVGAGHAVKAVNNIMMAINLWGASEGLLALEAYGVDVPTALSVINASSGYSNASQNLLPGPLATGEFPLRFKLSLLHKNAGIALEIVRSTGIPSPLTALATELLGIARGVLEPDADYIELTRALRSWQRPPVGTNEPDA
jgi:3-hydroxyisobutyrate dehydrogenase